MFSSLTLHKTTPNTTEGIRWAYVIEYMSVNDYDPEIEPPFYRVTHKGQPQAEFVQSYRGRNPINRLKHRLSSREVGQLLEWGLACRILLGHFISMDSFLSLRLKSFPSIDYNPKYLCLGFTRLESKL